MASFKNRITILLSCICLLFLSTTYAQKKIEVLIVDGQNNHKNWPETTQLMKKYLEETGMFQVDVATTPPEGQSVDSFNPDFSKYKVVLSNYNGAPWSSTNNAAFESFVKKGGGVVIIHAADNSFPEWTAYNQMIGLGGWGARTEKSGPYVYFDEEKSTFTRDTSPGIGGSHGAQHQFQVKIRDKNHPITKGMPDIWMHEKDELYDRLRGPAENMEVLATAYSSKDQRGSGRNEPMLMITNYGKGKVFHMALGHGNYSQKCVGFITALQRGTEWVAKGKVTQAIPADFPKQDQVSVRE